MGIGDVPDKPAVKPAETPVAPAPTAAPQASPTPGQEIAQGVTALKNSLQDKIGNWLKDVYNSNKILFYTVIPVMGLIYLVIKFHNIIIDFLLGNAKQLMQDAQAKDATLKSQADASKAAADALVAKADAEPSLQKPVDEDWNKK